MANHASALKRVKQSRKRRLRNKSCKSTIYTAVKKVFSSIEEKNTDAVGSNYKDAVACIDSAVNKGVLHRRTASRKISRLTKKVSTLSS